MNAPSARERILQRLRSAPRSAASVPDVDAYYRSIPVPDADRVQRFIQQAQRWRAQVIESTAGDWPAALARIANEKNLRRLLAGRGTPIAAPLAAAVPAGSLSWYEHDLAQSKPQVFDAIDAGITTTVGGIAETGSLILWPDPAEPRTLSLVPPVHIALLRTSRLHETLFDALRTERWAEGLPTNALLITGPSKTADIQRLLVYGAHGPRELVVILVRDA